MPLTFGRQPIVGDIQATDSVINLSYGNAGDDYDIGFYGQYTSAGTKYYTGFVRKAGTDYYLYQGSTTEPTSTSVGAPLGTLANLHVGNLIATTITGSTSLTAGTITGMLKATTGTISQAIAGTDYIAPNSTIVAAVGSVGAPSITFNGATTNGLWWDGSTSNVTMSYGGFAQTYWTTNGFQPTSNLVFSGTNAIRALAADAGTNLFNFYDTSSNLVYNITSAGNMVFNSKTLTGVSSISTSALTVTNKKIKLDDGAGSFNCVVGDTDTGAGITTGTANLLFGGGTGRQITNKGSNCLIGSVVAYIGNPSSCTVVGCNSLNNTGSATTQVVAIGTSCGITMTGNSNTVIGFEAGRLTTTGANNTFIGCTAGRSNVSGSGSVFIGYQAGYNELNSNKLYIANSSTATPLIYGDFNTAALTINGTATITGTTTLATALSGLLKATAGVVSTAAAGTDYEPPITAGTTAQYFRGDKSLSTFATDARATISASGNLSYNSGTGAMTFSATPTFTGLTITSFSGIPKFTAGSIGYGTTTTSDLTEGSNLYFTTARAQAAISASGNLSYSAGNVTLNATLTGLTSVTSTTFVGALTGNSSGISGGSSGQFYKFGGWAAIVQADVGGLTTASSPTFAGLTLSSALTYASGGTGQSSYAKGDLIIASAINTLTKLPIGSSNQVLAVDPVNGIPAWSNLSSFGVSSIASADTNIACSSSTGAVTLTFNTSPSITNLTMSGVISLGGAQPDTNIAVGRAIAGTTAGIYNVLTVSTLTTLTGAGARSSFGLYMANTFVSSTGNSGGVNFHNIFSYPTITATAATVDNAYSIYSAFAGGSGTITNAYNAYLSAPGFGTNRCSIYASDGQIGGTLISGSSKSGYLYIDQRLAIGGNQNLADCTFAMNRSYTSSSTPARNFMAFSSITAQTIAGSTAVTSLYFGDTVASGVSNTFCVAYGIYNTTYFNATNATIQTAYGIYNSPVFSTGTITTAYGIYGAAIGSATVTTAYSGYFASPAVGTYKTALYCDDFICGAQPSASIAPVPGRPFDKTGYMCPVGTIVAYVNATPPVGWLVCNGASLARVGTYADLFAVIGTAYGNPVTVPVNQNFNLPDFQGKFLRGRANGSANDPDRAGRTASTGGASGDAIGSLQGHAFQTHTHSTNIQGRYPANHWYGGGSVLNSDGAGSVYTASGTGAPNTGTTSSETRPINVYVVYIIKY